MISLHESATQVKYIKDMDECYDRIHIALSDMSGDLRITSFDIIGIAEYSETAELHAKLVGKRLADIHITEMHEVSFASNTQCLKAVADVIAKYQDQFLRGRKRSDRLELQK